MSCKHPSRSLVGISPRSCSKRWFHCCSSSSTGNPSRRANSGCNEARCGGNSSVHQPRRRCTNRIGLRARQNSSEQPQGSLERVWRSGGQGQQGLATRYATFLTGTGIRGPHGCGISQGPGEALGPITGQTLLMERMPPFMSCRKETGKWLALDTGRDSEIVRAKVQEKVGRTGHDTAMGHTPAAQQSLQS